tara:strand:- start:17620 stop:18654 length:1035 start_codon:yes stop_codon:yes gene_type:complete
MSFSRLLIKWYKINHRDLPWRNTNDPYKIWISEIILQQTRVSQGLPYYLNFIKLFPTVTDLANAQETHVLKAWQGLGYYSRARNMHFTAKKIRDDFNSIFPNKYLDIRNLKGVGDYTAAAIASFSFHLPYAVLDGNVTRFLSRYFAIELPSDSSEGKKHFKKLSQELLYKNNPALYNQAIMEFGALQCVPKSVNCEICILKDSCKSYGTNLISLLPLKTKHVKKSRIFFNYLFINDNGYTYVEKRNEGIWMKMYQFPLIEGDISLENIQENKELNRLFGFKDFNITSISEQIVHKLTHKTILARFIKIKVDSFSHFGYKKVKLGDLQDFPVPRLIDRYIKSLEI